MNPEQTSELANQIMTRLNRAPPSLAHTESLLAHASRITRATPDWQHSVQRMPVVSLDRYAGSVIGRFSHLAAKHESRPMAMDAAPGTAAPQSLLDLGQAAEVEPGWQGPPEETPPPTPEWFKQAPSFAQLSEAVSRARVAGGAAPSVQRALPAESGRPGLARPAPPRDRTKIRPVSTVEEVSAP